jgi:hypothetical protein
MSQYNRFAFATAMATLAFVASGGVRAAEQAVQVAQVAAAKPAETSIPLINQGGVRDWQVVGDDKVFIQDSKGKWYVATLAAPSPDLPYATAIGFETKGVDKLDKFGAIVVSGTRYQLASLVESGPPPPRKKG